MITPDYPQSDSCRRHGMILQRPRESITRAASGLTLMLDSSRAARFQLLIEFESACQPNFGAGPARCASPPCRPTNKAAGGSGPLSRRRGSPTRRQATARAAEPTPTRDTRSSQSAQSARYGKGRHASSAATRRLRSRNSWCMNLRQNKCHGASLKELSATHDIADGDDRSYLLPERSRVEFPIVYRHTTERK